jgi:hypothetical protein
MTLDISDSFMRLPRLPDHHHYIPLQFERSFATAGVIVELLIAKKGLKLFNGPSFSSVVTG